MSFFCVIVYSQLTLTRDTNKIVENLFLTNNNMDFRKGFGQLNQTASLSSTLNSSLNSSINISSAMGAGGYQHYGLNALGEACM